MDKILVSTRLEEQTFKGLQQIAQQQDRKVGYLVRKAVEQFVQIADKPRKPGRSATGMVTSQKEGG